MKRYQDFKFDNSTDVVEKFKSFIEKNDPQGKMRCRIQSDDVKNFVSAFMTNNLELV